MSVGKDFKMFTSSIQRPLTHKRLYM